MEWPKDRKAAFLWAAEAFGTPYSERTERQKLVTHCGICYAICKLTDSFTGANQVMDIGDKMGIKNIYWWPCGPIHDKERSLFCSLMAALSQKEFEELAEKNT